MQRLASLRLIRSENVGPVTFRELVNHFGDAQAALDALPELSRRGGLRRSIRVCPLDVAEAELERARRLGAQSIFASEPFYPPALAHIQAPPPMLYVMGRADLLMRPIVAIVGARNGSAAGIKLTRHFAQALGKAGFVVVSGLARGIDGAAHVASLVTGSVAVLAGGVDFIYPPEHGELQARLGREGCIVTEQPPGMQPRAQDFPRRNRIVSGVALGVVVVEAARRSGSLITVRMANEQGRLVLAVPGHPLDPRAEGTNGLIKQGATMATSAEDVLEAFRPLVGHDALSSNPTTPQPTLAPHLQNEVRSSWPVLPTEELVGQIRSLLGPAPIDVDSIVRASGAPVQHVRAALLELALGGEVEHHGRQLVSLKAADTQPN